MHATCFLSTKTVEVSRGVKVEGLEEGSDIARTNRRSRRGEGIETQPLDCSQCAAELFGKFDSAARRRCFR